MITEGLQEQVTILDYTATGPGLRLRTSREATDWTIEDVARHLRLKPNVIEGIENDDYSNPPQMVFLRGYLRAYAKLLNLPEDEIIASFNALHLQEEVKPAPVLKRTPKSQPISMSLVGGIAATLFAIIGLVVWLSTARTSTTPAVKVTEAVEPIKQEKVKLEAAKVESTLPAVPAEAPQAAEAPAAVNPVVPAPASQNAAPAGKQKRSDLESLDLGQVQPLASRDKVGPMVDDLSEGEGNG